VEEDEEVAMSASGRVPKGLEEYSMREEPIWLHRGQMLAHTVGRLPESYMKRDLN